MNVPGHRRATDHRAGAHRQLARAAAGGPGWLQRGEDNDPVHLCAGASEVQGAVHGIQQGDSAGSRRQDAGRHTDVPKRAWADFECVCFSTAHKAKGLEFEQVWLADDFMRFFEDGHELRPDQVEQEEVNILYVALTRARDAIRLSESFDEWLRHRRLLPT